MSTALISKIVGETDCAGGVASEVSRIQRHTARANRLIGDLVDVASIDAGRFSIVKAPDDVRALLTEAWDEFRGSAATKGVELRMENGPSLPAEFDHARLFQVVGNLIVNAIKFSPRGGRIIISADRNDGEIRCSVIDQGAGIPGDHLEKVFERFVQVDVNDRRGLGLGLFIAKQIVDGHSGRIWAESALGQGTSVFFTIPLQAA